MEPINKKTLIIRTQPSRHTKYLGDTRDPHFIPPSPIIDRPIFTAWEEADLKRACAAALAHTPHSDDMVDDPFRYLASAITTRSRTEAPPVMTVRRHRDTRMSQKSYDTTRSERLYCQSTTTPSETSKRGTIRSNATTPMTTPGLTPIDTDKRFSDVGRRPSTGWSGSALRSDGKAFRASHVYSFLEEPHPTTRTRTVSGAKSLTNLGVMADKEDKHARQKSQVQSLYSIEFNKSLTSMPHGRSHRPTEVGATESNARLGAISRVLKTVKMSRNSTRPKLSTRDPSIDMTKPGGRSHTEPVGRDMRQQKSRLQLFSLFSPKGTANTGQKT